MAELHCLPQVKTCPICTKELPISEFGICRARKDGRNLYCKSCIRQKVTQSRRALKEYKTARKKYISQQVDIAELLSSDSSASGQYHAKAMSKLSPVERVRDAIRRGSRTQREIAQETKLGKDEIGDALANLLLGLTRSEHKSSITLGSISLTISRDCDSGRWPRLRHANATCRVRSVVCRD
jgi:hypothetical protein